MKPRILIRRTIERTRSFFGEQGLKPFPVLEAFRNYDRTKLRTDARSGFNVAILAVPQGMAYAAIAELPISTGSFVRPLRRSLRRCFPGRATPSSGPPTPRPSWSSAFSPPIKRSGVLEELQKGADRSKGESDIFMTSPSNPNLSTRDALKRAQQLLGTKKVDVRIFCDPNKDAGSEPSQQHQ